MVEAVVVPPAAVVVPPAGDKPWFDGLDADVVGYVQNRGLDKGDPKAAFLAAVKAHREAEKLIGVPAEQVLRLPKDATDSAGWDAVKDRLGRPKDASGYDLAAYKDKVNEDFLKTAAAAAHRAGMTKADGEGFVKDIVAYEEKVAADEAAQAQAAVTVERANLLKEWGPAAEVNMIVAKNTATKLGVTAEDIAALESQIGYARVMKLFVNIGSKTGEDKFVTEGNGNGVRVLSSQQAADRMTILKNDQAWVGKFLAGDAAARQEFQNLTALMSSSS